jgi:TP901 family phage tail tape measure protein
MTDIAKLGLEVDSGSLNRANRDMQRFGKTSQATEGRVTTATGKMHAQFTRLSGAIGLVGGALATLAVGTTFRKVISATAAFETGLVGVGKTTGIAGAELEALGEQIRGIGSEVPVAVTELLDLAQAAGQVGVKGSDNIERFTETVAKLGIASDLAGEQASLTLARLLTVTETPTSEIDRLGASIVALGNNYAALESDIAAVATRVGQSTSQFGVSIDQVLGISTALKSVGVQAESGGTQVGLAFQSINDAVRGGGEEMKTLQEITGATGDALREDFFSGKTTEIFTQLIQGLGDIQARNGDVKQALDAMGLSGQRATAVLGTLASKSDLLKRAIDDSARAYKENTALNEEAATATETFNNQVVLLGNAFNDIMSGGDIDELTGSVSDLTDVLTDPEFKEAASTMVQWLVDSTTEAANLITQIASLKETLSQPFDVSDALRFLTGPDDPLFGGFYDDEKPKGATGDYSTEGATGDYSTGGATGSWGEATLKPITVTPETEEPDPKDPPETVTKRASEAARLIAQLQQEKALYGDLSNLEQARISLANGYYGPVSQSQAALILQLSTEQDERQRLADMREEDIVKTEKKIQLEARRVGVVNQLTESLQTQSEREFSAYQRRQQMIADNVTDDATAADLRGRNVDRWLASFEDGTDKMSVFSERARENIQDELGDTLEQTLSGNFDGILESWAGLLQQMAAQAAAAQIGNALFGKEGGDDGGGLLGKLGGFAATAIGSYFGGGVGASVGGSITASGGGDAALSLGSLSGIAGARATGGPVSGGSSYLVGERGPEIFNPASGGNIIPNNQINQPAANVNLDVQIINEGGQMQEQKREHKRGPNGQETIKIYVKQAMAQMVGSGEMDSVMAPYGRRSGQV